MVAGGIPELGGKCHHHEDIESGMQSEFSFDGDYTATKSAIASMAKQFAKKGIRVNGVALGLIWTPLQ